MVADIDPEEMEELKRKGEAEAWEAEKAKRLASARNHFDGLYHKDDKKVAEVIALVKENGGLEYAKKIMNNYHKSALDMLTAFEDNQAKKSLILLLDYVVNRKK